jgi:hypothetical protein
LKDGGQIPGTEMLIGGSRVGVEAELDDAHLEKITYRVFSHTSSIARGLEAN